MFNFFQSMTNTELKSLYPAYEEWVNEGVIPEGSNLYNIRKAYSSVYAEGAAQIMEKHYLRECTKRYALNRQGRPRKAK